MSEAVVRVEHKRRDEKRDSGSGVPLHAVSCSCGWVGETRSKLAGRMSWQAHLAQAIGEGLQVLAVSADVLIEDSEAS